MFGARLDRGTAAVAITVRIIIIKLALNMLCLFDVS